MVAWLAVMFALNAFSALIAGATGADSSSTDDETSDFDAENADASDYERFVLSSFHIFASLFAC